MADLVEQVAEVRRRVQAGELDLRDVGKLLISYWDQDFPAALLDAAAALKAAEAERPDPLAHYQTQQEAAGRYGFERGGLQSAWRRLERTDRAELEWAIVDALGMGGIAAFPGDGVGCAARIVEAQINRAEKAEQERDAWKDRYQSLIGERDE